MISKEAVAAFEARARSSWERYKTRSRAAILEELWERGFPTRFHTRPRLHQLVGYLVGMLNPKFLYFLDPGLGKTKLALDLFTEYKRTASTPLQALVFVPKKVHMGTWAIQVEEHAPHLTVATIDATSVEVKWEALIASSADLTIVDYQGFGLATSKARKGEKGLVKDETRILHLQRKYRFLVFDEVHRSKNKDTLRFTLMRQLVKTASNVYGLTGTPHGRDPEDLWGQFFLVDGGYTLGETLGLFRSTFYDEKPGWFGGTDYKFRKDKHDALIRFAQNLSLTYTEAECLDLPPAIPVKRRFRLSREQLSEYGRLRAGEYVEDVRVPIDGVFHRMREVTSGYVRRKVRGVDVVDPFPDNPKLDLIEQDLLGMQPGEKAIIFYDYNPTGEMLHSLLKRLKLGVITLNGATKDPVAVESTFTRDPKIRVLLCNSASGSEGINAQVATYVMFYEQPVSPITRQQAIKRAYRQGVKHRVRIIDYLAQGTVDETILGFVLEGLDLLAQLKRGSSHAARSLLGRM